MKYRKKPVVIDAEQFHANKLPLPFSREGVIQFADGEWFIETLESNRFVLTDGDFIIRGVKGEFYACKPDIFAATYEPAVLPSSASPSAPPDMDWIDAEIERGHYSILRNRLLQGSRTSGQIMREELVQLVRAAFQVGAPPEPK